MKTREENRIKNKKYYDKNIIKERERKLIYWHKHYKRICLKSQELVAGRKRPNRCEVCNRKDRICFDHNHKTGKFRAWLCNGCNIIVGWCDENPIILKKLIKYLRKHNG